MQLASPLPTIIQKNIMQHIAKEIIEQRLGLCATEYNIKKLADILQEIEHEAVCQKKLQL